MRTEKSDQLKSQSEIEIVANQYPIEWLNDKSFCMEAVDESRIPKSLLIPPDHQSPQHILNALNDDCLRTIFELGNFKIDDFCSIGSVCIRFNDIVKPVLALKFKDDDHKRWHGYPKQLWKIEEYYRVATVRTIKPFHACLDACECTIGIILNYCSDTIKEFEWYSLSQTILQEMRPVLNRLTHLNLYHMSCDCTGIFTSNAMLECLQIEFMHCDSTFPHIQLPKLKKLELREVEAHASMERFLQLNNQLTSLTFDNCILEIFGIERALKHLPNIQELFIIEDLRDQASGEFDVNCSYLSELRCLKTLHIEGGEKMMKQILCVSIDKQISLDCLILDNPGDHSKYPLDEIAQLRVKCLKIGRIDSASITKSMKSFEHASEVEIFSERMGFDDIRDLLNEISPTTKYTFRYLAIVHGCQCENEVVEAINKVRIERDIDLKILVEYSLEHGTWNEMEANADVRQLFFRVICSKLKGRDLIMVFVYL